MAHGKAGDVRLLDDVRPDEAGKEFLPGMGKRWLLPLYDPLTRALGVRRVHTRAAALAGIGPGQRVLDIGCGTGNLSFAVLRAEPRAEVTGLDPDTDALHRAARKAQRRRVGLTLVHGYADRLPVPDASLDHVVSSLALHHVPPQEKERMAAELARVLRPGGTVTIADFEGGHDDEHGHGHRGQGHRGHRHGPARRKRPGGYLDDNADGGIQRLLTDAGLVDAREVDRVTLLRTPVLFVQARRPR